MYDDLVKYVTLGGLPGDHVDRFLREVDEQLRGEPIDFACPPEMIKENVSELCVMCVWSLFVEWVGMGGGGGR